MWSLFYLFWVYRMPYRHGHGHRHRCVVWASVNANDWWFSLWVKHIIAFIPYRQNDGWVCRHFPIDFKDSLFCVSVLSLPLSPHLRRSCSLFSIIFFFDFCSCFFSLLLMLFHMFEHFIFANLLFATLHIHVCPIQWTNKILLLL